jgi:hypothetical protein
MKKLFKRKRKAAPAERPVVYSLPGDLAAIQEQASTMGGFVLLKEHWPDKVITSRANIELAAHLVCNRQQEWCQSQGKALCNDVPAYVQAFCEAFADGYQSLIIGLQRDPGKHARYMSVFGPMPMGEACQTVLTYPKEEQEASHGR